MLTVLPLVVLSLTSALPPAVRDFEFDGPGDGRTYAARLTVPAEGNGAAVLLIGGGGAFDIPWTTPGWMESEGHRFQVTLDGQDIRDGDVLAAAFAEAGFAVMQWSMIHTGDAIVNGMVSEAVAYPQSVEITKAALAALREQPEVDDARIVLVGHSLGVTRSMQVADEGVIGVVGLAGAYLDRVSKSPRAVIAEMWAAFPGADADGDGSLSAAEFEASEAVKKAVGREFEAVDLDGDGTLRGWEVTSAWWGTRMAAGEIVLDEKEEFRKGLMWPADVMKARSEMPVLLICGGLDDLSLHGALVRARGMEHVQVEFVAGVGHMLGEEKGFQFGPMSAALVKRAVEWAESMVEGEGERGASIGDEAGGRTGS